MEDTVSIAIRKCPFLAKVAAQNGTEYARGFALAPTEAVQHHKLQPAGVDAEQQYEASFQLFHGAHGIVPLVVKPTSSDAVPVPSACPFHAAHQRGPSPGLQPSSSKPPQAQPRTLPLATISLSFGSGPNLGDLLRKQFQKHQGSGGKRQPSNRSQQLQQPQQHLGSSSSASQGPGGGSAASSSSSAGTSGFKPQRPLTDPCAGSSSGGAPRAAGLGPGHGPYPSAAAAGPSAAGAAAPQLGPGTQLGSSSAHGAAGSGAGTGAAASRGGWSALGSGSSSGVSAFSGSAASTAPSPIRASASSTASSTSSSGVRGPGIGQGQRGLTGSSSSTGGPSGGPPKKPGSRAGAGAAGRASPASKGGSTGRTVGSTTGSAGAAATPSCPLRKWLGPFGGLVFNEYDKLICPPPIVAARAALSRTAAVQSLRPQQLPVKLVAVAAVAAASNLPCGAVREHFEKFSVGWFIAIHATIPFVAMLRKAVIMPKYAMVVTFAAAVIGQVIGSRLERARLAQLQQQGLQDPLTAWMTPRETAITAAAAAPAVCSTITVEVPSSAGDVVRGAVWRAKLLAGARAGLAGQQSDSSVAATASCGSEAGSRAVVGLGSWLPQLPVVKA